MYSSIPQRLLIPLTLLLAACSSAESDEEETRLHRAPPVPAEIDGVVFQAGNWEPHLAAGAEGVSWGNHRAVVAVEPEVGPDGVRVTIPWRRVDEAPNEKAVIVVDAASGARLPDVLALRIEAEAGTVAFRPNPGSTEYHAYYLPWRSTGGYYPEVTYLPPADPADSQWATRVSANGGAGLPEATVTHIEAVDDFHSFFPMEIAATAAETDGFMEAAGQGWRVVAEHRDRPIRLRHGVPWHWAVGTVADTFRSRVLRDEYFTFQVGVVAGADSLKGVEVAFEGFPASWEGSLTCFNCGGIDLDGRGFDKALAVPPGTVQPLWIGVLIPEDQSPGEVRGAVRISTFDRGEEEVPVVLQVAPGRARNHGFDEPELMTRLAWLNSTVGTEADFIIEPFVPVAVEGSSLSVLGRGIELGSTGLPDRIMSFFTPELTEIGDEPSDILAEPVEVEVRVAGALEVFRVTSPVTVERVSPGAVTWQAGSRSDRFAMRVEGRLEYDGMMDYWIHLVPDSDVDVDDISLPLVYEDDAAIYMLGLGRRGGLRPEEADWKWQVENHQEGLWLGGVDKGLGYVLRDRNYVRPLNTNFYRNQPLHMPPSWFNEGRGGIRLRGEEDRVRVDNYSGPRRLAAGDTLHFNVRFLITPFKPLDTETHFNTRFVHRYVPVDSVRTWGGTVVNIHHANEINPFINYPFYSLDAQAAYIDEAHEKGIKVKLYNTIRELTYKAHELYALRSFGDEIFNTGEGGGHSWLQEHLREDYHSAWHAWRVDDAAILNKGTSRWTNYYIEGLSWLAEQQEIDGLYLDDIAFSRETVKRMVSVLDRHRDEVVIDLHSANQFNERDGHTNSALLYMEHFPFISRLWFGEYFEYDQGPDYWMTEVAGLPFGLMGEMLQDGGHPYRGMLYGMTTRIYGQVDPRPVWAMMNDFGISESRMSGYWLEDVPVRVNGASAVLATVYRQPGRVLVALASWSDRDEVVELAVDRASLGLGAGARAWAPGVEGLQDEHEVDLSAVGVPANQGLFVLIEG